MSNKNSASEKVIAALQAKLDDHAERLAEQSRRIQELEKTKAGLQAKLDDRAARLITQARIVQELEDQVMAYKIEAIQLQPAARRLVTFEELPRTQPKPLMLILGSGRAGTTGLFYCLKSSAEAQFKSPFPALFEPRAASDIADFPHDFGVVKMILDRFLATEQDFLPRFNKRVIILRDPRDNFVSRLLWYVRTRLPDQSEGVYEETIELFAQKEKSPDSIGVIELFSAIEKKFGAKGNCDYAQRSSFFSSDFLACYRDKFFVVRYEDFVGGNLAPLSEYLEFEVVKSFELAPEHRATKRVGRTGSWKNWFTDDDHARFVRPNIDRLTALGYDDQRPHSQKIIEPAEATEYLRAGRMATKIDASRE